MMSNHSPRPDRMPWLCPYLIVKDADAALNFYQKAFNFEKIDAVPGEDGKTVHAEMRYKDQVIMLGKEDAYDKDAKSPASAGIASPVSLYVYCANVDNLYKQAMDAGAKSKTPPDDRFWGDRMCAVTDPDGHSWCFATYIGKGKK
jgi:PhnB protein